MPDFAAHRTDDLGKRKTPPAAGFLDRDCLLLRRGDQIVTTLEACGPLAPSDTSNVTF
jgi:hypothetical protein